MALFKSKEERIREIVSIELKKHDLGGLHRPYHQVDTNDWITNKKR